MSYQSKYTGSEIDALLDKVQNEEINNGTKEYIDNILGDIETLLQEV